MIEGAAVFNGLRCVHVKYFELKPAFSECLWVRSAAINLSHVTLSCEDATLVSEVGFLSDPNNGQRNPGAGAGKARELACPGRNGRSLSKSCGEKTSPEVGRGDCNYPPPASMAPGALEPLPGNYTPSQGPKLPKYNGMTLLEPFITKVRLL